MSADRLFLRAGALAGRGAPLVLVTVLVVLTFRERSFLSSVGWSPVHRTPVEWPSLLALGPWGAALTVTFVVMAVAAGVAAFAMVHVAEDGVELAAGLCLGVLALGMSLVSFSADMPPAVSETWHGAIHDRGYLLIPLGGLLGLALGCFSRWDGLLRRWSRALLPVTAVAFAATNVDVIAQLARYFAFAGLLGWVYAIGLSLSMRHRSLSDPASG